MTVKINDGLTNSQRYRLKHPEYDPSKWAKTHPEEYKVVHREWMRKDYNKNPEKYKLRNKEKYGRNAKKIIISASEYRRKLRQSLIILMGGKCVRCGESDWRCLQIDHVNGDGNKDRNQRNNYTKYFKGIIEEVKTGSKRYQLLCANCNWRKVYENKEWN